MSSHPAAPNGSKEPAPFSQGYNTQAAIAHPDTANNDCTPAQPRQLVPAASELRFACPWVKKQGILGATGLSCTGRGWKTAHRVKEHIKRRHCPQITCPRCHELFESQAALNNHIKADDVCAQKEEPERNPLRCTDEQMVELRPRRQSNLSEEDQWYRIFKICFPEDTVMPSPYAHVSTTNFDAEQSAALQLHMKKELTIELRTLLLDALSDKSLFPGMGSQIRSSIITAFESGLVQKAVTRAVNKYKRSCISVETTNTLPSTMHDKEIGPIGCTQETPYRHPEGADSAALPGPSNPDRAPEGMKDSQPSLAELRDQSQIPQHWSMAPEFSRATGLSPSQETTAGASFDFDSLEELDYLNMSPRPEPWDEGWLDLSPEPQQWPSTSIRHKQPGGLDGGLIGLPEQGAPLFVTSTTSAMNGKRRASRSPARDENEESEPRL